MAQRQTRSLATMSAAQLLHKHYTYEEYLALEVETGEKWEFFDGEVWPWQAMAGVTKSHNRIARNALKLIGDHLDGTACGEYDADVKLMIESVNTVRYPDAAVACEDDADSEFAIRKAVLLIEVTSDSSVRSDHQHKALMYTSQIPTLREYLIVEQHHPMCTLHRRIEGTQEWGTHWFKGVDAVLELTSINLTVTLGELYKHIRWVDGKAVERLGSGFPEV